MNKIKLFTLLVVCVQSFGFTGKTGYVPNPLREIGTMYRSYLPNGQFEAQPIPQEYDLRKIGHGTAPIRNQGQCGSCWWFGTKGTMESLVRLRDGKDIEISGQWGIDCSPAAFSGCGGGDMAFDKLKASYGAIYESEYPIKYEQSNDSCDTSWLPGNYHEQIVDWAFVGHSVEEMQRAMFENESPITVTVGSGGMSPGGDGWQDSCRSAGTDHIVYVVGWLEGSLHGHSAGPHWILQNSWGTSWGDNGYEYIMARSGSTVCASLGSDEVALANYKPSCTPQPTVNGGPDVNIIMAPGMAHFAAIGTPAADGQTYSWSPSVGLSASNVAQPAASPAKTTLYTVTATSKCGSASGKVLVHVFNEKNQELK